MATRTSGRTSRKRTSHTGPRLRKASKALRKRLMPRSRGGKRAMATGLGLTAVLALTMGLVAESLLSYTVSTMGALGAAAVTRAERWQAAQEQEQRANRRSTNSSGSAQPSGSQAGQSGSGRPPPTPGQVKCTETGKPVEACECSSRHVATAEGASRYGRPVGSPIGRRKADRQKQAATTKSGGTT